MRNVLISVLVAMALLTGGLAFTDVTHGLGSAEVAEETVVEGGDSGNSTGSEDDNVTSDGGDINGTTGGDDVNGTDREETADGEDDTDTNGTVDGGDGEEPGDGEDEVDDKEEGGGTGDGEDGAEPGDGEAGGDGDDTGDVVGDEVKDDYADATPTDTSVTVTVNSFEWDYEETADMMSTRISAEGKTTGDVDHCSYAIATYFDDGTVETSDFVAGPIEFDFMGVEFFFGGKETNDDWSSWKLEMNSETNITDDVEENETDDGPEPVKIILYVRAYSDDTEGMWNQDSETKSLKGGDEEEDDDDDGAIPGFGGVLLLGAMGLLGVAMIMARRRR